MVVGSRVSRQWTSKISSEEGGPVWPHCDFQILEEGFVEYFTGNIKKIHEAFSIPDKESSDDN